MAVPEIVAGSSVLGTGVPNDEWTDLPQVYRNGRDQ
jgi:hypothetical protein